MSRKKIRKGKSDFKYIITNNGYFVDKTLLISEFYENSDHVLIIPRPRRFGKTLNLSMIEHFFDIRKKESVNLFSGFKITKEKAFCEAHQNKYPVINLSLKSVRANNWEGCFAGIQTVISETYQQHKYLLKSEKLEDYEKQKIRQIILQKGSQNDYKFSLYQLSKYLSTHFENETIILLDEYDTPIISGYSKKYYDEVIVFMQVFLGAAFKGNAYLKKGLITGILRIARESLFSEMNNVGVFTITDPYFADKFGFTEPQVKAALTYFGLEEDFKNIKQWYDGYKFGDTEAMYNPWSIVNYIARHKQGFKPYWINTGTDSLIKERVLEPDYDQTYDTLQALIAGDTIEKTLYENFVFGDFDTHKRINLDFTYFFGLFNSCRTSGRR